MIRVFEAFAGVGSQAMALRNIGVDYKVVAISEIDKYAIATYEAIHGEVNNVGDISKLGIEDIPEHDLFTYSFPCQDISTAGAGKGLMEGSNTRSSLLWECRRVIEGKKPKYLLLENVKNLVGKKHKPAFDKWLEWLESQGYQNYWKVLNAKDFGVPQNRERVFVVSILGGGGYNFPEGSDTGVRLKDLLEDSVGERYYIENEKVRELIHRVKREGEKGNDRSSIVTLGNIVPSKHNAGRVVGTLGISPTVMHNNGKVIQILETKGATKQRVRKLTPKECWRLQGFKDTDYYVAKRGLEEKFYTGKDRSNSQMYRQAGNSIAVPVLEGIFGEMLKGEELK